MNKLLAVINYQSKEIGEVYMAKDVDAEIPNIRAEAIIQMTNDVDMPFTQSNIEMIIAYAERKRENG